MRCSFRGWIPFFRCDNADCNTRHLRFDDIDRIVFLGRFYRWTKDDAAGFRVEFVPFRLRRVDRRGQHRPRLRIDQMLRIRFFEFIADELRLGKMIASDMQGTVLSNVVDGCDWPRAMPGRTATANATMAAFVLSTNSDARVQIVASGALSKSRW